jgi:hypothetical protein
MSLLLVELVPADGTRDGVAALIDRIGTTVAGHDGELIEAQVTADGGRAFVIVEHGDPDAVRAALRSAGVEVESVDPVRLVGADLAEIKAHRPGGQYLVEWDLPAGLTMDAYLARKKEKAPLYANVPEATFLRTYVREDMAKCLCFYDGEDEGAVLKARDAVSTPIDRFHELAR